MWFTKIQPHLFFISLEVLGSFQYLRTNQEADKPVWLTFWAQVLSASRKFPQILRKHWQYCHLKDKM